MDVIKEKDILIEKMLDPGATLTDEELQLVMQDEELREILEVSAVVRSAAVQPSAIDVEKEWRLFRHRLHPGPSRRRWAMRVAAIFIGVLLVSAIVRVGIDRLMTDDTPSICSSEAAPYSIVASTLHVRPRASEATSSMCSSEAVPSANEVAALPLYPPQIESKSKKKTRKSPVPALTEEEEMEVDEYLRLQQARIDNELAMMQAELYVDELQALRDLDPTPPPTEAESRLIVMP